MQFSSYHQRILDTFEGLDTRVENWETGKFGILTWPQTEDDEVCQLCGWNPLVNRFYITNTRESISLIVGSQCVKHYIEVKHNMKFKDYFDALLKKSLKNLKSLFFSQYKNKKNMYNGVTREEEILAYNMYDVNKFSSTKSAIRKLYNKTWKLNYSLPSMVLGFGEFPGEGLN